MKGKINTDKGTMVVEFYEKDAPNTVANFIKLANEGFYDGLKFHRVISNFMVQGGCPDGNGTGGPGYTIQCEHQLASFSSQQHDRGVLSMAHAGPNTGGSQFFISHNRQGTQHLDGRHTCFGKVIEGLGIVDQIQQGDKFNVEIEE
jgi:peptidyl-prolyl cis-trans isomerase B (cyclophilin B)